MPSEKCQVCGSLKVVSSTGLSLNFGGHKIPVAQDLKCPICDGPLNLEDFKNWCAGKKISFCKETEAKLTQSLLGRKQPVKLFSVFHNCNVLVKEEDETYFVFDVLE